jgi:hypothetical protein
MIYIGCTLKPVENWQSILPAPTAPSNYKDRGKIDAYIQNKLAELMNGKAATSVLSGAIAEGVILTDDKKIICGNGIDLIDQLIKVADFDAERSSTPIVGYKIHRNLRLAAIEYISSGKPLPRLALWMIAPISFMKYGNDWYDPISLLFGTSDEDKVDIDGACRRLDITDYDLSSADGQAQFAKTVTERICV